jgi:predicted nucleic acid-binding protein
MSRSTKIILLDADVISHFISSNEILFLQKILVPHSIAILDNVYREVARISSRKRILDNLLSSIRAINIMPFPIEDLEVKKEFALIKKNNPLIGDGERACMAVAKYHKNIIASSNYRDIVPYCKANNILYLGTLDILTIALKKGVFDTARCNNFISTARRVNNARFPSGVRTIDDYVAPDLSFI